ncbi:roadblock/LC7 domain-containing protein [Streptomyces sp. NPDC006475]|uniref:roadblock/LC7 domain-containing protein n=1 Tax=Streptomyces sp. NPDC006475 TaxID=3155719 RepID=UPI0033B3DD85
MNHSQSDQTIMDWMLKDLADAVPRTRSVVVLSTDGVCIAQHNAVHDTADRMAAACAGLQGAAGAIASELPHSDGRMNLVALDMSGGFFFLMSVGSSAFLAVLAEEGVDGVQMGLRMRDLVPRIEHLCAAPRQEPFGR